MTEPRPAHGNTDPLEQTAVARYPQSCGVPMRIEYPRNALVGPAPRRWPVPGNGLYTEEISWGETRPAFRDTAETKALYAVGGLSIKLAPEFIGMYGSWLTGLGMTAVDRAVYQCRGQLALCHFLHWDARVRGDVIIGPDLLAPTMHRIEFEPSTWGDVTELHGRRILVRKRGAPMSLQSDREVPERKGVKAKLSTAKPAYAMLGLQPAKHNDDAHRLLHLAGWRWDAALGCYATRDPYIAATMASYASPEAAQGLLAAGIPGPLLAWQRHAPCLMPAGRDWLLIANRKALTDDGRPPQLDRGSKLTPRGVRIKSNLVAAKLTAYAAKPLAHHLLAAARANTLNDLSPMALSITPDAPEGDGSSQQRKPRLVICARCKRIAAQAGTLPPTVPMRACTTGGCSGRELFDGAEATLVEHDRDLLPAADKASRGAYRQLTLGLARETWRTVGGDWTLERVNDLVPSGESLKPGQAETVLFTLQRTHALNANPTGSGKTVCTLLALRATASERKGERCLLVVPAAVIPQWLKSAKHWLAAGTPITRLRTTTAVGRPGVYVTSYETLMNHQSVRRTQWDWLVMDEAHALKNPKAQRTRTIIDIRTKRALWLTATPIYNRPDDLYPVFHMTWPEIFKHERAFRRAFRVADPVTPSADNRLMLAQLAEFLRDTIMQRVSADRILAELPDKPDAIVIDADIGEAKEIRRMQAEALAAWEAEGVSINVLAAITKLRMQIGRAKIDRTEELLCELLGNGERPLVFCLHREVAEEIAKRAGGHGHRAGLSMGGDSTKRQANVDAFQRGDLDVLVCTYGGSGVGLDLFTASAAIMHELSWNPSDHHQAEARAYRIGQKGRMQTYYVVADQTVDGIVAPTLAGKRDIAEGGLGDIDASKIGADLARAQKGRPASNASCVNAVMRKYQAIRKDEITADATGGKG